MTDDEADATLRRLITPKVWLDANGNVRTRTDRDPDEP